MNQVIAADSMISGNFENLKSQIPANIRECYYQSMTGGVTSKIEVANDLSDKKLNVSAYPSSNSWLEDHTAIFIADGHITDGDIGLHVSHLDDNGKNGRVIGLVGDDESERFGVPTADEIEKYVGEHGLPDFPELLGVGRYSDILSDHIAIMDISEQQGDSVEILREMFFRTDDIEGKKNKE